jgi:hypothetical protein
LAQEGVEIAGIVRQPYEAWMKQVARNLTDYVDGFLRGAKYFIHDRDPLFCTAFRQILKDSSVKTVKLPPRPDLNPYAERFVRSIKEECLNKLILLGGGHLRSAVREFVGHYHIERPHQGLGNELITPANNNAEPIGTVQCRERLGPAQALLSTGCLAASALPASLDVPTGALDSADPLCATRRVRPCCSKSADHLWGGLLSRPGLTSQTLDLRWPNNGPLRGRHRHP